VNKANSIMGLIRRTYTYLDEQSFKYLFQALVRLHIEYAEAVWSPFKVGDIEKVENVQRRATKQVPTLKNMEYNERLKKLKMPTLKYRRMRAVFVWITDSGRLFHISTILTTKVYFLTFSLLVFIFIFLLCPLVFEVVFSSNISTVVRGS
jgi:hypothetical protein